MCGLTVIVVVVTKLLILKILLNDLMNLVQATTHYDYGYHASAEEFDNFLSATKRTWWTHKADGDRLRRYDMAADRTNTAPRHFVPKFQYKKDETQRRFKQFVSKLNPTDQDLQAVADQKHEIKLKPLKNIDSFLNFNYFSPELPKPLAPIDAENNQEALSTTKKPIVTTSSQPALNLKPLAKPLVLNASRYALNRLYKNNTQTNFPIYFTNPATGIIYAITEMGKSTESIGKSNGTIPIFISKEQYERDILQLENEYKLKCLNLKTTTVAPQIIRLHKPLAGVSLKGPLPVLVETELIVKDKIPLRIKKKKTKQKLKIKKRPPGHRVVPTTLKPVLAHQPEEGPAIIMGSRLSTKPFYGNNDNLSTQLEKPNYESVFSSGTPPLKNLLLHKHNLNKRSLDQELQTENSKNFSKFQPFQLEKNLLNLIKNKDNENPEALGFSRLRKVLKQKNSPKHDFKNGNEKFKIINIENNSKEKSLTKLVRNNSQKLFLTKIAALNQKNLKNFESKHQHHHVRKRSTGILSQKHNLNLTKSSLPALQPTETLKFQKPSFALENSNATFNFTNRFKKQNLKSGLKRRKAWKSLRKRKRLAKVDLKKKLQMNSNATHDVKANSEAKMKTVSRNQENPQDDEYNFFDMEAEYDDDDDDDEDNEYDEDDDDEENEQEAQPLEDYSHQNEILAYDDHDYPHQTHTLEAGLSAENFSGKPTIQLESDNSASQIPEVQLKKPIFDYENIIKKRIRRRPSHDDYEDEEDDNSFSANFGEFLRMIFYPVQMVMSSVLDSFSKEKSHINPYTKYATHYNRLKQHDYPDDEYDEDEADDADEDEDDSNESNDASFSSWFRSWFAFNRRNKKIGSTTSAPVKSRPTKSTSWLPTWLSFGANDRISTAAASNEDYDEYDKWFASWFGELKPKAARRRKTTTSTTTTQIPHVPILTIVDPMKNPQNWIGILAHHIINHTSTSTINPLKDIWNRVTTTTTENPEVPRKISYDKYQIWRLKPHDEGQVKALEEYKKSEDGIKLHWLKGPSLRGLTDVLVPPKMLVNFQASLTFELIDHEVLIFDVGKAIAYEKTKEDYLFTTTQKPKKHSSKNATPVKGTMSWHKYYEYDDIINYLQTMRMRFPHLVELIHIGRSYEGRPLIVMKIESKEAAAVNSALYPAHLGNKLRHKKRIGLANAVFIEAGTHGMEWIAPATATWIINELLRIMKKNITDDSQSFIRNTTWYIMPVLNPDGYVYSHEYDRFWKKSRSHHISRPSGILNSAMTWLKKKRLKEKICFGVDLDRNWRYQWGKRGSSKSACNEFYAGPTPFSEPETKALSEFLMDYRTQIKLFVSMQSYGQIVSYPYKANTTYDIERLDDLLDVAMVGINSLRKNSSKSRYKIDSSNDLVENRSGCSDAFAAYEVGIPFSYTLQLADNGVHGYLLPSASIESTAKDAFEIITGMLDYI